jgi:hypothetical protein
VSNRVPLKRGSTFSYGCPVLLPVGVWAATAHVRDGSGSLIDALTVTLTPPSGSETHHQLLLVATAVQTADWPRKPLFGDVKFSDADGVVMHTGNFIIDVEAAQTV